MFGVWQTGKGFKGRYHGLIDYYTEILEGLSKTTKMLSQYIQDESAKILTACISSYIYRTSTLYQYIRGRFLSVAYNEISGISYGNMKEILVIKFGYIQDSANTTGDYEGRKSSFITWLGFELHINQLTTYLLSSKSIKNNRPAVT